MSVSVGLSLADCIVPDWPAPPGVRAIVTTRAGGVSTGTLSSLNLGRSVGDAPEAVAENRRRVAELVGAQPRWMSQVHGIEVADLDRIDASTQITADAAVSRTHNVCNVMMADCLTVLFSDREGGVVAAAHAGWRGLLAGVLESTVAAMHVSPAEILAYLGPAIGPGAFEVGGEVRDAFLSASRANEMPKVENAFVPSKQSSPDKWMADIYELARIRLVRAGLPANAVYGGTLCTYSDPARFFSYRRGTHEKTSSGRMAALIWRE